MIDKERTDLLNERECILTDTESCQIKKYLSDLLDLYRNNGVTKDKAVGDILDLLGAVDCAEHAAITNITRDDVKLRFPKS